MSQSLFIAAVLFQVLISHCSNAFAKSNSIKQRNGNSKQQSIEKGAFRDSRCKSVEKFTCKTIAVNLFLNYI